MAVTAGDRENRGCGLEDEWLSGPERETIVHIKHCVWQNESIFSSLRDLAILSAGTR